ncbi:MAG: glycosyl hydrolase family 8 [Myxococcota bacterium]
MKLPETCLSIALLTTGLGGCVEPSGPGARGLLDENSERAGSPGGGARNLFAKIGKSSGAIDAKVDEIWDTLVETGIYNETGDMAYIYAEDSNDVRSEGMSYGMMLAVQLDREADFRRLWKWARTHMYNEDGPFEGYYAWQCDKFGNKLDPGPAPDGELYFAAALFMADERWGSQSGIFDYRAQANTLLDDMRSTRGSHVDMFDNASKLILFVPQAPGGLATNGDWLTDPSYHVPTFLHLFGNQADSHNDFWYAAEDAAREFLRSSTHPVTGLTPEYATFDGAGANASWSSGKEDFRYDSHRVIGNIGMDYAWRGVDNNWQHEQIGKQLNFFWGEGIDSYLDTYRLDGSNPGGNRYRANSLIAMNAVGCLAANIDTNEFHCQDYVERLWDLNYVDNQYAYYPNLVHAFAVLHAAGRYEIYGLDNNGDGGGLDGTVHRLNAKHSGRCVDVAGASTTNGAHIQQWGCYDGNNQKWRFERSGDDFRIVSVSSDRCMEVKDASTANGATVQQWSCHGGDHQLWTVESANGGALRLRNKKSGKCLDVAGVSQSNGAHMQQWNCSGGDNQAFNLD